MDKKCIYCKKKLSKNKPMPSKYCDYLCYNTLRKLKARGNTELFKLSEHDLKVWKQLHREKKNE